jgi:predicted O-methyltransferase YrrM
MAWPLLDTMGVIDSCPAGARVIYREARFSGYPLRNAVAPRFSRARLRVAAIDPIVPCCPSGKKIEMTQPIWNAVDHYLEPLLIGPDEVLDRALEASAAAQLPAINVSPLQGRFLNLLARIRGVRAILEIGTLGGYSTICMARALGPDGRLISLEIDARHAEVARAGLAAQAEVRLGAALQTLATLAAEDAGPFDLVFIDADKANIPAYFQWSLKLTGPGSVIVVDNVVRAGAVVDAASGDESVQGVRRFNEMVAAEPRVSATAIQTVGVKGYDGFALLLVTAAGN